MLHWLEKNENLHLSNTSAFGSTHVCPEFQQRLKRRSSKAPSHQKAGLSFSWAKLWSHEHRLTLFQPDWTPKQPKTKQNSSIYKRPTYWHHNRQPTQLMRVFLQATIFQSQLCSFRRHHIWVDIPKCLESFAASYGPMHFLNMLAALV